MTAGSAASLPRHALGAPLSLFRLFDDEPTAPAGSAPPVAKTARAADDPPRGRVVLFGSPIPIPLHLLRQLRRAGWALSGPASSVPELGRLIGRQPVDCAIVDLDHDARAAADAASLLARAGIPVVFLGGAEALPESCEGWPLVRKPWTSEAIVDAVDRAVSAREADQGDAADDGDDAIQYPVAPPTISWPRVMPQL